jgi:hypothetical protein
MRALTTINALIWGALSWSGWHGLASISAQSVGGYPNPEQKEYYLYLPLVMVTLTIAGFVLSQFRKVRVVAMIFEILLLVAVLPFLLPYGGGV